MNTLVGIRFHGVKDTVENISTGFDLVKLCRRYVELRESERRDRKHQLFQLRRPAKVTPWKIYNSEPPSPKNRQ